MKKSLFLAIIVIVLFAGCGTTKYVREAYPVPTPYVPEPPVVERPNVDLNQVLDAIGDDRPFESLSEEEKGVVVRAYRLSALAWKAYALRLEQVVAQYGAASVQTKEVKAILDAEIARINAQAAELLKKVKEVE